VLGSSDLLTGATRSRSTGRRSPSHQPLKTAAAAPVRRRRTTRTHRPPHPPQIPDDWPWTREITPHTPIIIDEVGYIPFDQDAANLFFQLIASRSEQAS